MQRVAKVVFKGGLGARHILEVIIAADLDLEVVNR
jgi:hypothetical protein